MTLPLFLADAERLRLAGIGDVLVLDGAEGRHAATVRRLRVGESLDLTDGAGLLCAAEVVAVQGQALKARLLDWVEVPRPRPVVTVVQALAKGDRDERAVETMTEVGVDAIVPWQAARSIVQWDGDRARKGVARWQAVARAAAKQARRPWLVDVTALAGTPEVVQRLKDVTAFGGLAVVLHEAATVPLTEPALSAAGEVVLVVGPEGGVSDEELAEFDEAGAIACRLGPTVLRTSTAGTVGAAVVFAANGRWA
jgi:16S rRNA (uracil1498-N3)-methyltransferase